MLIGESVSALVLGEYSSHEKGGCSLRDDARPQRASGAVRCAA